MNRLFSERTHIGPVSSEMRAFLEKMDSRPFILKPDQTPLSVTRGDRAGEVRAKPFFAEGADVPIFYESIDRRDIVAIAPKLEADEVHRAYQCQDRAAVHIGAEGLEVFSIGDGVTDGYESASVADTVVQISQQEMTTLRRRNIKQVTKISASEGVALIARIKGRLESSFTTDAIIDGLNQDWPRLMSRYEPQLRSEAGKADVIRQIQERGSKGIGSSTIITGMVQREYNSSSQETRDRVSLIRFGDGGAFVIGPHGVRCSAYNPTIGAPPQLQLRANKSPLNESTVQVIEITLRPKEILFVCTDGLEKFYGSLASTARRAQELYEEGIRHPKTLTTTLIWEARGNDGWRDDTTVLAHECAS